MTAEMDHQTKIALLILGVLIAFVVVLAFYGTISGWFDNP